MVDALAKRSHIEWRNHLAFRFSFCEWRYASITSNVSDCRQLDNSGQHATQSISRHWKPHLNTVCRSVVAALFFFCIINNETQSEVSSYRKCVCVYFVVVFLLFRCDIFNVRKKRKLTNSDKHAIYIISSSSLLGHVLCNWKPDVY